MKLGAAERQVEMGVQGTGSSKVSQEGTSHLQYNPAATKMSCQKVFSTSTEQF
jgi:hypothetical protein